MNNREIKFRAWDKIKKRMLSVYHLRKEGIIGMADNIISSQHCKIDNVILMQYTGVKDRNKKEVYEGDIIKYVGRDGKFQVEEIVFIDGCFCRRTSMSDIPIGDTLYTPQIDFMIVGNIYENKELDYVK